MRFIPVKAPVLCWVCVLLMSAAYSCDCPELDIPFEITDAALIVRGVVTRVREMSYGANPKIIIKSGWSYRFRTTKAYKGKPDSIIIVHAKNTGCERVMENEKEYLVYANEGANQVYNLKKCTATKPFENASVDLKYIDTILGIRDSIPDK
jgi:hypothetical protein